jgi:hypothetical protein
MALHLKVVVVVVAAEQVTTLVLVDQVVAVLEVIMEIPEEPEQQIKVLQEVRLHLMLAEAQVSPEAEAEALPL